MENKYLCSITKAAAIFNIGRDKLYEMARSEPDMPIIRIGSVIKVNVPLMEQWLDKATKEGRKL